MRRRLLNEDDTYGFINKNEECVLQESHNLSSLWNVIQNSNIVSTNPSLADERYESQNMNLMNVGDNQSIVQNEMPLDLNSVFKYPLSSVSLNIKQETMKETACCSNKIVMDDAKQYISLNNNMISIDWELVYKYKDTIIPLIAHGGIEDGTVDEEYRHYYHKGTSNNSNEASTSSNDLNKNEEELSLTYSNDYNEKNKDSITFDDLFHISSTMSSFYDKYNSLEPNPI